MILWIRSRYSRYWILFLVWWVLSIHVGYLYTSFSADKDSSKGGTFIEASLQPINYLPYLTTEENDLFYQSLLFQGCLYPTVSGTDILYREELCTVTTKDYKLFTITPKADIAWSDGVDMTLNDLLFTYKTLLKDNYRNISSLEPYKNITVQANEDNTALNVAFPQASIDNIIFFTNFILPAHLLANQSLESYIQTFHDQPVGTSCGRLQPIENDPTSVVFDLAKCDDMYLKFYQVKQFTREEELLNYTTSKENTIDLIISPITYAGYRPNQVVTNKFSTLFFNTRRVSAPVRQWLARWASQQQFPKASGQYLVKDQYLFDAFVPADQVTQSLTAALATLQAPAPTTLQTLPDTISRAGDAGEQVYQLSTGITDKLTLKMQFAQVFDKVSITFNNGVEYFPESFDPTAKTTLYNFNPTFRNIAPGKNTYTIKGYLNGTHIATFTLVVSYLSQPTSAVAGTDAENGAKSINPLKLIYFDDPFNKVIIQDLVALLSGQGLAETILIEGYHEPDVFAGKLASKDYDIALRTIAMGLRKDVGNLFLTDNADINPSLYTNPELSTAISNYFLASEKEKGKYKLQIDAIYRQDTPFVLLGKQLSSINIRQQLDFPYPYRLYVLGWRKDFLRNIMLFKHLSVNRDKVFDKANLENFLRTHNIK